MDRGAQQTVIHGIAKSQEMTEGLSCDLLNPLGKGLAHDLVCSMLLLEEGDDTLLQYSCPENPMDGGA